MTRINHSRPYLLYIDNLRRENNKAVARHKSIENKRNTGLINNKPKRTTFWDKMAAIKLSEIEEQKLFELLEISARYFDAEAKLLSLTFKKGVGEKKKSLQLKINNAYRELVHIGEQIILLEIESQIKGREKGLIHWWELLETKIRRDGASDFWELVNNHVLREAFSNVESRINI